MTGRKTANLASLRGLEPEAIQPFKIIMDSIAKGDGIGAASIGAPYKAGVVKHSLIDLKKDIISIILTLCTLKNLSDNNIYFEAIAGGGAGNVPEK